MTILGWIVVVIIAWQLILYLFYNEEKNVRTPDEYISDVIHNARIEKKWREDGKPIVHTVVGWRPDPINGEDGYKNNGDGSYSKLIRGGTEKYKERFRKDVENSKETIWKEH